MIKYIEHLYKLNIFTLEEVCKMTGNINSAKQLMHNYCKKGIVSNIRKGLYCVTDLSTRIPIANKYEIGCALSSDTYVSYHSAFEYHGFVHQTSNQVQLSSTKRIKNFNYNNSDYCIYHSHSNQQIISYEDSNIKVTTIERTIVDCIDKIDRVGGIEELIHCLSAISYVNSDKILDYLETKNNCFLYQKSGFILSYFRDNMLIESYLIDKCKEVGVKNPKYLTSNHDECYHYHKEWKLYAPQNILSYIEQGNHEIV